MLIALLRVLLVPMLVLFFCHCDELPSKDDTDQHAFGDLGMDGSTSDAPSVPGDSQLSPSDGDTKPADTSGNDGSRPRQHLLMEQGWEDGEVSHSVLYVNEYAPDHCCEHSLSAGTANQGFPVNEGGYAFRAQLLPGDPEIKGHTGRAELTSDSGNGITNALYVDRWFGFALYVEDPPSDFTFDEQGFFQWHVPWPTPPGYSGGAVALGMHLDGGPANPWQKNVDLRIISTTQGVNYHRVDLLSSVPQERVDADGSSYLLKDNLNGAFNDLGDWLYLVFRARFDGRPLDQGNDGRLDVWFSSKRRIASCSTQGQSCYTKLVELSPWQSGPLPSQSTTPCYLKIGIDDPGTASTRPAAFFFDSFRVGDENASFDDVDPAIY